MLPSCADVGGGMVTVFTLHIKERESVLWTVGVSLDAKTVV